jgi:hypothetical protein
MVLRAALLALTLALAGPAAAGSGPAPVAAARPVAQARAEPGDPVKWYRVRPSYDGQDEYLYEIAERFLGDGERLDEIFELNRDRPQPDGGRLTVPDEIESGWVLRMPADADGPGLEYGPLPAGPATSAAAPTAPAATSRPVAAAPARQDSGLLIAGVVLALAGVVLAGWLFRRRRVAPVAAGVVIPRQRTGGLPAPARAVDAAASWTIDRALRVLATSAAAAGRPLPPIARVSVDDTWITLRLGAADESPCEPWQSREHGLVWVAGLRSLQALPADQHAAAPCPRLVTLGTRDGTRELLDLGQITGTVGLRGDAAAGRGLLAAWAAELTGSPWSSGVRVVAGGLLPEIGDTGPVLSTAALDDAITQATGDAGPDAPPDGWLSVLLLGAAPAGRDADRIQELTERPGRPWAVVVLGRPRAAALQLTLHPDGRLETGTPGITVQAIRPVAEREPV